MQAWKIRFVVVLALLTVPVPAPASAACGHVSIAESLVTLNEGSKTTLHVDNEGCAPWQYEILIDTASPSDFVITIAPDMLTVDVLAVLDMLTETDDVVEIAVQRLGATKPDDSAKVTIAGDLLIGPVMSLRNVRGGETLAVSEVGPTGSRNPWSTSRCGCAASRAPW